ncbi:MAG TPA: hypothetical protein VFQ44_02955 [Streptosporangiaceae bacterium]|nr:hypothetical protein [Streptosporangiaceae bacterium]
MSFWVILDDSLEIDELLAGAGAAALGAALAELVTYRARSQVRMRIEWCVPALRLPLQLVRDTGLVFLVLWKRLARGEEPDGGFRELPVRVGPGTAEGRTRRTLIVGGLSVAPNRFVAGLDLQAKVMVVHELVRSGQEAGA